MNNYAKPEVQVLGDATRVIQGHKLAPPRIDAPFKDEVAASYEGEE
jgi:hypothetical protein